MNAIMVNVLSDLSNATKFSYLKKYIRTSHPEVNLADINFEHLSDTHFRVHILDWHGRITYASAFSVPDKFGKYIERKYLKIKEDHDKKNKEEDFKQKKENESITSEQVEECKDETMLSALFKKRLDHLLQFLNNNKMRHTLSSETLEFIENVSKSPTKGYWL